MMKRRMVQAVSLCCLLTLAIAGCSKTSRRPSQPSDSDGLPNRNVLIIADVEEKIAPPPQDDAPAAPTAAPADAPAAAPADTPAAAPAPATAAPAVVPAAAPAPAAAVEPAQPKPNPLKAAFDKKDVLAVAEETPSQPAPVAPAPAAPEATPAPAANDENLEVTAVQKTVIAFAQAVEKTDEKTFKENIIFTKAEEPMVKTMWAMITEMNGFEKDMKKAYGQKGVDVLKKNHFTLAGGTPPTVEDIQTKMQFKVIGNTAQATLAGQVQPMTLVKTDGKWKVQLFKPGQMQGPQANMAVTMTNALTKGMKNARKMIGQPGMTPEKVMQEVSKSMMPNPAMLQKMRK